jgi:hypothetical protein
MGGLDQRQAFSCQLSLCPSIRCWKLSDTGGRGRERMHALRTEPSSDHLMHTTETAAVPQPGTLVAGFTSCCLVLTAWRKTAASCCCSVATLPTSCSPHRQAASIVHTDWTELDSYTILSLLHLISWLRNTCNKSISSKLNFVGEPFSIVHTERLNLTPMMRILMPCQY